MAKVPVQEGLRENGEQVWNVTVPTLQPFLPDPAKANGMAVVIAPGGGFRLLVIHHEGTRVARWLAARGVAAFVLKYRLIQSPPGETNEAMRQRVQATLAPGVGGIPGVDSGPMLKSYRDIFLAQNGGKDGGKPLCVNPVTFDTRRTLSLSSDAKGAVAGDQGFGPMGPLKAGAVAAECRDGLLTVWPAPSLGLKPLPGGSMHYHDVGLFWADISANAALRAKAWLKAHGSR
ncbi:alpha/beta hydrolase [Novosphingobium sp. ES2-1]|uniref:alpha/beta hydrolase n=1 Tax=Novosphingobium sp. ES2-1 TaxID=2780074 RepID=UPI00351C57A5